MTTTTPTTTPTAAMLDRLAEIGRRVDFGHGNELEPHLAAAAAGGYELPDAALAVAAQGIRLSELHRNHVKPAPWKYANLEALLSGGIPIDAVLDGDDAHAAAMRRWERAGELLIAASSHLAGECNDVFAPIRDQLITGPLRAAVADLLKQAKSAAGKLQAFAPDFPPTLLADGNAEELETWRASRLLQRDFNLMLAAWRTSWYRATRIAGRAGELGRQFRPMRAGLWYAWTDPLAVPDERLRLGIDSEILRVATVPVEYRLIAPSEFTSVYNAAEAANPANEATSVADQLRRFVCS
jgi:hypothetical protein